MKRIRIGNDINVVWSLMRDDAPFLLNAEKISLYLMAPYGRVELTDYSVEGNSVTWLFQGRHQKAIGKYTLVLVVNKGEEGMITTDACDFVELVSCSCKADGADACGVETEYVNLVSKVDVGGGSGGGSSYDDTEIRTELSRLDAVKAEKAELTELSSEVSGLSERVENLEQGGQGGGTPSGDPMHYMFEAVGATYNATGADIPMVGIYGDSYVHKAKHWHLNELGDITSEEMREIYAESFPMRRRIILESAFANTNIRTNIPIWKGCDTTAYGSAASTKVSLFGLGCDCSLEVFAWVVDSGEMMNIVKHLNLSSVSNLFDFRSKTPKIKKVLGEINLSNISSTYSMFSRCTSIEEIRLYKLGADLDIKLAPRLSYASIKFLLANSNATSKKTLTLHATALANAEAAYLADVEQDTTTYPTLSDWALSKNIQIATA